MKICHVWDADYPWDVRVNKVCAALSAAGNEVHLVARNRNARSRREILPEAIVHRLPSRAWLPRSLNEYLTFPAFFNPFWLRAIYQTASREKVDVIVVRDLPLAPAAIAVGRLLGIPVVLDMAENYGAMMQAVWDSGVQRHFDWLVRNPRIVRRTEKWVISRIDHTLVVVEESRERLEALGVQAESITVVSNTPEIERLQMPNREGSVNGAILTLVYLGLLEKPRGLDTVIKAIAKMRKAGSAVRLEVIGDGRERASFEALAISLGLTSEAIRFHGYVENSRALAIVRACDIGVVPHVSNESWNTTIPNKLFDYMAAGIPVLTSDAKPAARVVRDAGCGLVFKSGDADSFALEAAKFIDKETRFRFGLAGQEAVRSKYNWGADAGALVHAVTAVVQRFQLRNRRVQPDAVA